MNTIIIKLNATGDVVRTTTLLRRLTGHVTWVTASMNVELLSLADSVRCLEWEDRERALDRPYDLAINLEDDQSTAAFCSRLNHARLFGAHLTPQGTLAYTDDSRLWFDLSLISVHGRAKADQLKLENRRTYQELIFEGLGYSFDRAEYVLPSPAPTGLGGDVAIAPVAGPIWPMKGWAFYDKLKTELERTGLRVNVLPRRDSLLEHMGDIANHRVLVSGDSLPMHLALGTATPCVTLFNCTSPWEIYDYGRQTKLISPRLEEFFYKRDFDVAATQAIRLDDVYEAVMKALTRSATTSR
jgi:ADP-heptose:LPS heptosyltransferase